MPKCIDHKIEMQPIGYSIFDVVFGCPECDREFSEQRSKANDHIVKGLKTGFFQDCVDTPPNEGI